MSDEVELTADQVRTAINQILSGGQSSTMGDISVTRANLDKSYELLEKLESREARQTTRPVLRGFNLSGAGY